MQISGSPFGVKKSEPVNLAKVGAKQEQEITFPYVYPKPKCPVSFKIFKTPGQG